ncbi:Tenascin-X [Varanus komodoensis]|nr:Tenascin-X [Varanus komodoensis]
MLWKHSCHFCDTLICNTENYLISSQTVGLPYSLVYKWWLGKEGWCLGKGYDNQGSLGRPGKLNLDPCLEVLHLLPSVYFFLQGSREQPFALFSVRAATATSPEVTTERVVTIQLSLDQLSVSDVTSNSVQLSWVVPMGNFDSFLVQYEDTQGKTQELPVDGDSRVLIIPDLEPSQRYQFNLYGVYGGRQYGPLSIEAVTGQQWLN